jgi:HEAT repeat protein
MRLLVPSRCLLRAAALVVGTGLALAASAGFASADGRKGDVLDGLLERYHAVEGRHDDAGYETARQVLEEIADVATEESRRLLLRLAGDHKNGDRRHLVLVLSALVRQGGPAEVDAANRIAEGAHDDSVVATLPHVLAAARREDAIAHLRQAAFLTATPDVKARIARALGLMGDKGSVVALLMMLREDDVRVRSEVLSALADLGDESAFPHMATFLKVPDARVREVAARALGALASPRAVPHLVAALADGATLVVESAARSLGLLGSPAAVDPLIDRLALALKPATPAGKAPPGPDGQASDLRLADTIEKALERLTGMALGDDPDLWRAWWKENRDKPPADTSRPNAPTTVSGPRYYGFGVRSSRVLFVLDVSGSMGWNERLETARKELVQVLEHLPQRTRFGIVTYSDVADAWTEKLVYATPENVRKAVRHVERLEPLRATNTYDALRLAFKDEDVDTVFFLSDGSPTVGALTDPDAILADVREMNRFRRVRINTIALIKGDPPPRAEAEENRPAMVSFMKRLAEQNDGKYVEKK